VLKSNIYPLKEMKTFKALVCVTS